MIGMQLVVQNFADGRLRIIPGMFAEWAIVADCRPDFFEGTDVVVAHIRFLKKVMKPNSPAAKVGFFSLLVLAQKFTVRPVVFHGFIRKPGKQGILKIL